MESGKERRPTGPRSKMQDATRRGMGRGRSTKASRASVLGAAHVFLGRWAAARRRRRCRPSGRSVQCSLVRPCLGLATGLSDRSIQKSCTVTTIGGGECPGGKNRALGWQGSRWVGAPRRGRRKRVALCLGEQRDRDGGKGLGVLADRFLLAVQGACELLNSKQNSAWDRPLQIS